MLPLGHASEAGKIAMTSLDASALIDDVKGMEFLAQTLGSGVAHPDMASRFCASARSARVSKVKNQRSIVSRRRMAAVSELI